MKIFAQCWSAALPKKEIQKKNKNMEYITMANLGIPLKLKKKTSSSNALMVGNNGC